MQSRSWMVAVALNVSSLRATKGILRLLAFRVAERRRATHENQLMIEKLQLSATNLRLPMHWLANYGPRSV